MNTSLAKLAIILILILLGTHVSAQTPDATALIAATNAFCHSEIAMLGESATHGDGHTEAFKVALIQRLVTRCGFDTVLFESSHYEFLNLSRQLQAGRPVASAQLLNAVGGLWKSDREFQPLVPFLLARARAGKLTLGGLDDQLGQAGQNFANIEMVEELTSPLAEPRKAACALALHHRIFSDYPEPESKADQSQLLDCLSDMQVAAKGVDPGAAQRLDFIANIRRWIERDFLPRPQQITARDASMFLNFEAIHTAQYPRHKVIVWATTVHIARQKSLAWSTYPGHNFGWYIHQNYGEGVYALGFASRDGSYRQGREIKPIPPALACSLEAEALRNTSADAVFLSQAQLRSMKLMPGSVFLHTPQILNWADALDAVVVFRTEHPPTSTH